MWSFEWLHVFFFKFWRMSICVALPLEPSKVFNIWSAEIRTRFNAGFLNLSKRDRASSRSIAEVRKGWG